MMVKEALFLCLLQTAVLGKHIYPVPDPYRWDESFTVELPRIDDEHRGLFNAILLIERDNTKEHLTDAYIKYRDHFEYEEGLFSQTKDDEYVDSHKMKHKTFMDKMTGWSAPVSQDQLNWAKNWLVQHIKNTDFEYVGEMPHSKPRPYTWDHSFEVFYARLDDEHKVLFDVLREVGNNLYDAEFLSDLKFKMKAHFEYEQAYFCESETYTECESHKAKHNKFFNWLYNKVHVPVQRADIEEAQNWLAQHIKNTDFKYKHKLNTYHHEVPRPYVWNKSLQVFYKQLDDEHVGLFDAIRESVNHPEDAEKYESLKKLMKEHFDYEEAQFLKIKGQEFQAYAQDHIAKHQSLMDKLNSNSVPLDCDFIDFVEVWLVQHIRNTDFAYRGHMLHDVPNPYVWDESFTTFYKRIDDEHKKLFDCIKECGEDPSNKAKYANCKNLLRLHFDYEEFEFCKVPHYECHEHYLKHFRFQTKFQSAKLPLAQSTIDWAKNWLVQHIKNTDHAYRGKLLLRMHYAVPDPYVWDKSFTVDIKQMDDEHVGLFDVVRELEASPDSVEIWNKLNKLYNEHFAHEEDLFTQILDQEHDIADHRGRHLGLMKTIKGAVVPISKEITEFIKNWLTQHIKNTDFTYVGKMPKTYPIPDPFYWDATFAVYYPDMDEEHKPLFSCLEELKTKLDDKALLESCLESYIFHFNHEQDLFTNSTLYPSEEQYQHINKHNAFLATMKGLTVPVAASWIDYATNWLTQHIKNTDFRYKEKMPHPVADPYVWDESFLTNYDRIDDEHKVLFKAMQDLSENPDDVDLLNFNRDVYRDHFDYEEKQFMACGEKCHADSHKKKHDVFYKTLTWVTTPVSQEYVAFAKNWLAQHIKNTDFLYKYKLPTQHKVPEPYVWNREFAVFYKTLDDEHKVLFDNLRAVEEDPLDEFLVGKMKNSMIMHFEHEEVEFCDAKDIDWDYCKDHKRKHTKFMATLDRIHAPAEVKDIKVAQDWLAQHIKNTDFEYRGKLKHAVPNPYVWDETFATDYKQIDDEHTVLFENILAVSQHPEDPEVLAKLKTLLEQHFEYEEGKFCEIPSYNCIDHKMKHYKFFVTFKDLKVPIGCEEIHWAKNWLAQHIKNTDHQYKERFLPPY